jgi:hypothetical protein
MADLEKSKDMNPNGFWEMLYTVQGIQYRLNDVERLNRLLAEENKSICKIVSQGLANSDPRFIDKIIYMVRHPRQVAKSQERLKRNTPLEHDVPIDKNGDEIKVHTPKMYINVTAVASRWVVENPDVPVLQVNFDDLLANPKEELSRISDFLGEGDFSKADGVIEPRLKRSNPEPIENALWEDAEFIYDRFINKDYQAILDLMEDNKRKSFVSEINLFCTRCNQVMAYNQCKICRSDEHTRNVFKQQATLRGINWGGEPCIFECLDVDPDVTPVTIKESIENNFWFE